MLFLLSFHLHFFFDKYSFHLHFSTCSCFLSFSLSNILWIYAKILGAHVKFYFRVGNLILLIIIF